MVILISRRYRYFRIVGAIFLIHSPFSALAEESRDTPPQITLDLPITTQGPLWPPSALSDSNGDFILVGSALVENDTGQVELVLGQSMIVSKNTVPPLDEDGVETFLDSFGAPYEVVRHLDLSDGSPDLDLVLHSHSYGPPEGNFGGGPRVPAASASPYNLNSFPLDGQPCPDVFPSNSQRFSYMRPSFPLHQVPISGFQGDNVAYDPNTGRAFLPKKKTGSSCPPIGCSGENMVDSRRQLPITLGEWLKAEVNVEITLTDFDEKVAAYTAARFTVNANNLLPNSVYHVFAVRTNMLQPIPVPSVGDPLGIPSVIITDEQGRGRFSVTEPNPFPAPETDDAGLRIIGVSVAFRSSFQNDGACVTRYGPGVDVHALASSFANGTFDFTDFITKPALSNDSH